MENYILEIQNLSKKYRLGQIGSTTLRASFQRARAKRRHEEDPTRRIGKSVGQDGTEFWALKDVSLRIRPGERVGIIGQNGAGKSTLLKLISRITAPTEGCIGLNGRVSSLLEVGTGFHNELTGRENIFMSGAILGMTKTEVQEKLEDIIDFSEIRPFIDTPVKRYSSGMLVKLAFAVAAHLNSEILIMDEVLAVGDLKFQKKCIDKMTEVSQRQDRTILYVSHNMETIRALCTRCIVLEHGRILYDGDPENAIELYVHGGRDGKSEEYELDSASRSDDRLGTQGRLVSLVLPEKHGADRLSFTASAKARCALEKLHLRAVIRYNGTDIAFSDSSAFFSMAAGEQNRTCFDLDITMLSPGVYTLLPELWGQNELGQAVLLDRPDTEIFFRVSQRGEGAASSPSLHLPRVQLPPLERRDSFFS